MKSGKTTPKKIRDKNGKLTTVWVASNKKEEAHLTLMKRFAKDLIKRGIKEADTHIIISETDFGNSAYMYIGEMKIRSSGHSVTNPNRIKDEYHLSLMSYADVLDAVEYTQFPKRFKVVEVLDWGNEYEFPRDKLNTLKDEYKLIKDKYSKTKKGRVMSKIIKKNIPKTRLVRVVTKKKNKD